MPPKLGPLNQGQCTRMGSGFLSVAVGQRQINQWGKKELKNRGMHRKGNNLFLKDLWGKDGYFNEFSNRLSRHGGKSNPTFDPAGHRKRVPCDSQA